MLQETQLGPSAIVHIRDSISYGFTLENELQQMPIELGHVVTYLPESVAQIALENFHAYLFWSREEQFQAESLMEDIVIEYLSRGKSYYAFFEDAIYHPHDPHAFSAGKQTMYNNNEIYYYLTNANTPEEIRTIMEASVNFRAVGICFHADQELSLEHGKEIPDAIFDLAVDALDILLVGAYDEGSWLKWTLLSSS